MSQTDDHTLIRRFIMIVVGLVLLTVVLIFVARSLQLEPDVDANPSKRASAEQRIKPVGGVRVGAQGAAALAEAQAATASAQSAAAEMDGEQVYNGSCVTCHEAGVADAPIPGSDQMTQRLIEKGIDTLVMNAIDGINVMPPRGGNPGLTDEQIRAAVEFMLP